MRRTHARKTSSPKRRTAQYSSQPAPAIFWLLAGVILALFILGLVYLHQHKNQPAEPAVAKKTIKKQLKQNKPSATKESGPQFDFYTMLPEGDVPAKSLSTKTPVAKAKAIHQYVLQAGAFKNYADADKVRANLILQGFNVQIKAVEVKGVTWQRIVIGPYQSLTDAQRAQAKLDSLAIKSLLFQLA